MVCAVFVGTCIPHSHNDFHICSFPPETEWPFLNAVALKALFLSRLCAIEPSDVNMFNHGTFFESPSSRLYLEAKEGHDLEQNEKIPMPTFTHPLKRDS